MIFKKVEINNFFSYGEDNVIEFTDNGIVFIRGLNKDTSGSNGAGKSTVIDAIVWCLFGKTIRGVAADDVVNRNTASKKNTKVVVHVDDYILTRYRKHTKGKNGFILTKDGKDVSLGSTRESTKALQKLFNITFDTFINSIVLGSNVNVNFLGTDSNSSRRSIFENILGLDLFPQFRDAAKEQASIINEGIVSCESQINLQTRMIEQNEDKANELDIKRSQFEINRDRDIAVLEDMVVDLKKVDVDAGYKRLDLIKELRDKSTLIQAQVGTKQEELYSIDDRLSSLRGAKTYVAQNKDFPIDETKTQWDKVNELNEKLKKATALKNTIDSELRNLDAPINALDVKIKNQEKFIGKPCPTCGTTLDQTHLNDLVVNFTEEQTTLIDKRNELADRVFKVEAILLQINISITTMTPCKTLVQLATMEEKLKSSSLQMVEYDRVKVTYDALQEEAIVLVAKSAELAKALTEQPIPSFDREYYDGVRDKIIQKTTMIDEKKKQENPYAGISFDEDIAKSNDIIKLQTEEKAVHENDKAYYDFWVEGFGNKGLKIHIFESVIEYFNKRCQFYLEILSNGKFKIKFDKDLSYEIVGTTYKNNSSGERKRVDLAVMMGLFDLLNLRSSSSSNLLILDEVLDSLDEVGVDNVNSLLLEMNKYIPNIYVISHNNTLGEYFPKTVTVTKENGVSKLC